MRTFTASNGVKVTELETGIGTRVSVADHSPDQVRVDSVTSYLDPRQVTALREYFQHERDERLGWWRWPEHPEYLVGHGIEGRSHDRNHFLVHSEPRGWTVQVSPFLHFGVDPLEEPPGPDYLDAVRAYIDAHPVRKPWHDAKPGEVWILTYGGEEVPAISSSSESGRVIFTAATHAAGGSEELAINSTYVTDGERIWPKEEPS